MKSLLNKTKSLVAAGTLALLMGGVGLAEAVTINFNDAPVGNLTNFYAGQGVTFSNAQVFNAIGLCGGSTCGAWSPPQALAAPGPIAPGSPAFSPFPLGPIVATFSFPVINPSIFVADVGVDGAAIVAYDALVGGNIVGLQQIFGPLAQPQLAQTLTVLGGGVRRIELFQPLENGQQPFGDGVAWDNLSYTADPIPEPSTMLLLGSGLAGIVGWRYRKQQA